MIVTLTKQELIQASEVAKLRNQSQRAARRHDGKVMEDSLLIDTMGAEGELAAAKALNLPWDGKFLPIPVWDRWKHNGNDIGKLEVRTTSYETGRLILHHSDKAVPYLLVISSKRPEFRLAGWLYGNEGQAKRFWATHVPRPCFMVRQEQLHPIEDLIKEIDKYR